MVVDVLHVGCAYHPYLGGSTVRLDNLISSQPNVRSHVVTHTMEDDAAESSRAAASVHRIRDYYTIEGILLLRRLSATLRPNAVVLHNPWIILLWCCFIDPFHRIRRIAEIHNFRDDVRWKRVITGFLYRRMDAVVVLSKRAISYACATYGLQSNRVHAIRNGVPPDKELPQTRSNAGLTFSYIGTIHEWQGVLVAANAILTLDSGFFDDAVFIIAGGGPVDDALQEILKEHIADGRVHHLGWVSATQADQLLDSSDVVLIPRISTLGTEYILPLKVFEAMRQGKAILATDVGGLTEVLTHNKNAWIVAPNDAVALAEGMRTLSADAGLRTRLGKQAQQDVAGFESWSESGAHYEQVLYPEAKT